MINLILAFDTETTSFVLRDREPDDPNQPHLVQLGAILAEEDGTVRQRVSLIVRPEGYVIPKTASDVHGITTEKALAVGLPHVLVVATFVNLRALASEVVAHNFDFDEKVMNAAIFRTGKKPSKPWPEKRTCTVDLAAPIVNLPPTARMIAAGFNKPKPPKLSECYSFFFGEELVGAHDASIDAEACLRVFFEIRKRQAANGH